MIDGGTEEAVDDEEVNIEHFDDRNDQ